MVLRPPLYFHYLIKGCFEYLLIPSFCRWESLKLWDSFVKNVTREKSRHILGLNCDIKLRKVIRIYSSVISTSQTRRIAIDGTKRIDNERHWRRVRIVVDCRARRNDNRERLTIERGRRYCEKHHDASLLIVRSNTGNVRTPEEDGRNVAREPRIPLSRSGFDPSRNKLFITTRSTLAPYENGVGWPRRRPRKHPTPIFARCCSIRRSLSGGCPQYKRKSVHTHTHTHVRARARVWFTILRAGIQTEGLGEFVTAVHYKKSGKDPCFVPLPSFSLSLSFL